MNREAQGIRKILLNKNKQVMEEYTKLKEQWKNKEITKEEFDQLAKKNAADSLKTRPVVVIKPGPNTTYGRPHQCYRRDEHQPDFSL